VRLTAAMGQESADKGNSLPPLNALMAFSISLSSLMRSWANSMTLIPRGPVEGAAADTGGCALRLPVIFEIAVTAAAGTSTFERLHA
jgi:hypothetical protein